MLLMRTLWPILDPDDLDRSFLPWLTATRPLIATQRALSARTAANYLAAIKVLQLGPAVRSSPVLAETPDLEALTTSLLVTGPLSIKRAMTRGVPLARALATAERASSAAAMRHTLDGGRRTILDTVRTDPDARGWQRVASGNACKFCNLLDGKFHLKETADFPAHDGCSCSQEPVYGSTRRVSELSLAARR